MFKKSIKIMPTLAVLSLLATTTVRAHDPILGEIKMFGFNFAPRGYAFCDGQLLSIASNTSLFSLLGVTFGGDGRTTFGLPDLRGRVAVHPGTGPGLSPVSWGETGGAERKQLSSSNMPSHVHEAVLQGTSGLNNQEGPADHSLAADPREKQYSNAAPNVAMNADSITIQPTGGGQAFDLRNPYLGIYHSIALQGLYPSRN